MKKSFCAFLSDSDQISIRTNEPIFWPVWALMLSPSLMYIKSSVIAAPSVLDLKNPVGLRSASHVSHR